MATTTPDNLFSPDPTSPYNLVADWATSMSSVQSALVLRANAYVGTSAQRIAFTTAPEGAHWQDTNGQKLYYTRNAGAWVEVAPSVSEVGLTISNSTANYSPSAYRQGGIVHVDGGVSMISTINSWVTVATLPVGFRPAKYQYYPAGINTNILNGVRVQTTGAIEVFASASNSAVIPLTGIVFRAA